LAAVQKAVNLLGRTGAPMTRASVSQLAGVSRSFTYENEEARAIIAAAQARTDASAEGRMEKVTAQQEASWRERALNAEDQLRTLRQELITQRRLVGDLIGQLREPDGTWIEHDRDRLRKENDVLLSERNQLARERDDLQCKLSGARANISRLTERRVTELFPDGPGRTLPS
jgi:small-conductance mechanosensitive channel